MYCKYDKFTLICLSLYHFGTQTNIENYQTILLDMFANILKSFNHLNYMLLFLINFYLLLIIYFI